MLDFGETEDARETEIPVLRHRSGRSRVVANGVKGSKRSSCVGEHTVDLFLDPSDDLALSGCDRAINAASGVFSQLCEPAQLLTRLPALGLQEWF